MILEISTAVKTPELPVINGMKFDTFKVGEFLTVEDEEQFAVTTELISEIKNAGITNIVKEIDVTDLSNIRLKVKEGINVDLGSIDNIRYKVNFAKSIIEDATKKNLKGTIEMSHKGNPVFKPE